MRNLCDSSTLLQNPGEGCSKIQVKDLCDSSTLLQNPGEQCISLGSTTAGGHSNVLCLEYASEIGVDSLGRRVFANFARICQDGNLFLLGYWIQGMDSVIFDKNVMINLASFPNARPTLNFVLTDLLCPEITINPDKLSRHIAVDDTFRLGFAAGSNHIVIKVTYDPTSNSPDPAFVDISYCQTTSVADSSRSKFYALDYAGSSAVQVASSNWNDQEIRFTDWLKANEITDYSSLSQKVKYQDFILFLRGQVTDDWNPSLLPSE